MQWWCSYYGSKQIPHLPPCPLPKILIIWFWFFHCFLCGAGIKNNREFAFRSLYHDRTNHFRDSENQYSTAKWSGDDIAGLYANTCVDRDNLSQKQFACVRHFGRTPCTDLLYAPRLNHRRCQLKLYLTYFLIWIQCVSMDFPLRKCFLVKYRVIRYHFDEANRAPLWVDLHRRSSKFPRYYLVESASWWNRKLPPFPDAIVQTCIYRNRPFHKLVASDSILSLNFYEILMNIIDLTAYLRPMQGDIGRIVSRVRTSHSLNK